MAISRVQATQDIDDSVTTTQITFDTDVTAGNLLVVCASKYFAGAWREPVAGDLTKVSGTATIGTVLLDNYYYIQFGGGPSSLVAAIFSVPVTSSGSLTLQVDFTDTCSTYVSGSEYAGADISASRVNDSNVASGLSTDPYIDGIDIPAGGVGVSVLAFRGEENIYLSILDTHWDEIGERDETSSQPLIAGSADELSAVLVEDDSMYWDGPAGSNYWAATGVSYSESGGAGTTPLSADLTDSLLYG